jgi:hypothetical protein
MRHTTLDPHAMHTTVASTPQLRRLGLVAAVAGAAVICAATLTPQPGDQTTSPFCVICGSLGGVNTLLNVLLFMPLGAGLAMSGVRAKWAIAAMLIFSGLIEVAQLTLVGGRDATTGDVLANSVGGALGFALVHFAGAWVRPTRRMAHMLAAVWGLGWLGVQVISSYAFVPDFPPAHYYGQIARSFEDLSTFEGSVLSATIDTVVVPNVGYAKSDQLREMLLHRSVVAATVIPRQPTPAVAPIIRVDTKGREIVLLAQYRRDLAFGVRTGAAVLRVRPPLFILHDVFPDSVFSPESSSVDTLRLAGRYGKGIVQMSAKLGSSMVERRLPVSPALAWTLVTPGRWYISGSAGERFITLLSIALLLIPLGYWSTVAGTYTHASLGRGAKAPGRRIVTALAVLALFLSGLVAVPVLFGLPALSSIELIAGLGGLVIGCVGALVTQNAG